jgi:NDP-sugar pyrophosphorylase family protein
MESLQTMQAIVMAGGFGKRMNSPNLPKVLHEVQGEPMIYRIVKKVVSLGIPKVYVVCGIYQQEIKACLTASDEFSGVDITYVHQLVPQGTGHAIMQCIPYIAQQEDTTTLILNGDTPLINKALDAFVMSPVPSLMVTKLANPAGQGRIVSSDTGKFERIVEDKDASDEEKDIKTVNCGVYLVSTKDLLKYIPMLDNNNAQNEYYLTDICARLSDKLNLYEVAPELQYELLNVNNPQELRQANLVSLENNFNDINMVIRPLKDTDYEAGYLELMGQLSDTIDINSKAQFTKMLSNIKKNDNHYMFVVEDTSNGRVVANVTLLVEPKFIRSGRNVGHVEDVVVHSDYRGKKIGVLLLKYVSEVAIEKGCYKCILDCKHELLSFYKASGFSHSAIQMSKYY